MSERVESIRNNKKLIIDDINFGRVIATELYDTSFRGYEKHLAKCLLYNFTVSLNNNTDSRKVFEYSLEYTHRKDFNEIRDIFLKFFDDFAYVDVNRVKSTKGMLSKICSIIKLAFSYRFNAVKTPLLCAILVTEYQALYKQYKTLLQWDDVDFLVTFCDARCEDNLLAQMAINSNVKTATLQHGQYRVLDAKYENADVEAYNNFISDYLLAWGNATVDEFKKAGVSEQRVLPVGALKALSFCNKAERHEDTDVFGVVLCGETYEKSNFGMIKLANEIAQEYGLKYFLRFHPKNDVEKYISYADKKYVSEYSSEIQNEEYASKVDFSIIHMTGVFVELLCLNSILFVYSDEYLEDLFKIQPYCFSMLCEFKTIYTQYKDNPESAYIEQYKHYHYFNSAGNVEKNYKNAIAEMLQK